MQAPVSDVDVFADDVLADPHPTYRALRDLGPVVWLPSAEVYAVPRYAEVREALGDAPTFCSGRGVGFNPVVNEGGTGGTIMSDGEVHRQQREIIGRPLTPKALAAVQPQGQAIADAIADGLVRRGRVDAVADVAEALPLGWVPDLLGLPVEERERLLGWVVASFDVLGPFNARAEAATGPMLELAVYAHRVAELDPPAGSMIEGIRQAAATGEIAADRCPTLVLDYLTGALQTTVSALGSAVWLFATHPDQWELLRREPERVKTAFNEVLRLETPITMFSRVATGATELGGVEVPEGARIAVMFASANRDERRWDRPDEFDITRDSAAHLGFGFGDHACAGMGLARLQGAAVLSALATRVERIELDGEPVRRITNTLRSFRSVPIRLHPA